MVPCLSSGFAKHNKFMFVFVSVSFLSGRFEDWDFCSEDEEANFMSQQSDRKFLVNFSPTDYFRYKFGKKVRLF